jgi:hypothetical protein
MDEERKEWKVIRKKDKKEIKRIGFNIGKRENTSLKNRNDFYFENKSSRM